MTALVDAVSPAERPRRPWSQVAFAAALTTFMVGTFASFGGISYAAEGMTNAVEVAKRVAKGGDVQVRENSAAADQYHPQPPGEEQEEERGAVAPAQQEPPVPPLATAAPVAQLPFTGISLATTAGLGLGLIVLGLILRRREQATR